MKRLSGRNKALLKHIISQGITPKEATKEMNYIKRKALVLNSKELYNYIYNTIEDSIENGSFKDIDNSIFEWTINNALMNEYYNNLASELNIKRYNNMQWYIDIFGMEDFKDTITKHKTIYIPFVVNYIINNNLINKVLNVKELAGIEEAEGSKFYIYQLI